jgi:hypothetical protein
MPMTPQLASRYADAATPPHDTPADFEFIAADAIREFRCRFQPAFAIAADTPYYAIRLAVDELPLITPAATPIRFSPIASPIRHATGWPIAAITLAAMMPLRHDTLAAPLYCIFAG